MGIVNGSGKGVVHLSKIKSLLTRKIPDGDVEGVLNDNERLALEVIRGLGVKNGLVPKHTVEGHLMYGDKCRFSISQTHKIISVLKHYNLISYTRLKDGEYYKIL